MTDTSKDFKDIFVPPASASSQYVQKIREEASKQLQHLEMPNTKHEEWKYTSLKNLTKENFGIAKNAKLPVENLMVASLASFYRLVIVNGFVQEETSLLPPQAELLTFKTAEKQGKLDNLFGSLTQHENDYFNALNATFCENGFYLHIPKNTKIDKPLVVYHINLGGVAFLQRNTIVLETGSQASIIHLHLADNDAKAFVNEVSEIFLAENAHLQCYKIQNEKNQSYRIDTTQVSQKSYSKFVMTTISLNGGIVRNNLNALIEGQYCETYMNGLTYIKGKTHIDHHTLADHRQPNSYSHELYKGLYDENSTGVFNGKIYVRQHAQKTNAYQQNRNVLLSEQASIYTKPQLEIWADDVKCSHGATTGKLDEAALFYMRARGISEAEARKLLLKAFAGEILERIEIEELKEYAESLL
ncbi:MAG: Fe-S cluster assembly protein SufD [Raineya sp.]